MREFLLATLWAPLSSWGDIAVGEVRGSSDRPSRSAILGLMAAALGLEREDRQAHHALDIGFGVAARLDSPGTPLVDYHTVQTVAASELRKRPMTTRAGMLSLAEPQTIVSRRGYRQELGATLAIWGRGSQQWTLGELQEALRHPAFVLYAGRKANPLGCPLAPEIVSAPTLADALSHRPTLPAFLALAGGVASVAQTELEVSHDECDGFGSGLRPLRRETRRDGSPDRERWQFALREVEVGAIGAAQSTSGEKV